MPRQEGYTTADELAFVAKLTEDKLSGYLLGCSRRLDWGKIDRAAVMRRVKERLMRIPVFGEKR